MNSLEKGKKSLARHTINLYLQSVKGMLNWAVETRKIPYNPLTCIKPLRQIGKRITPQTVANDIHFDVPCADGPCSMEIDQTRLRLAESKVSEDRATRYATGIKTHRIGDVV